MALTHAWERASPSNAIGAPSILIVDDESIVRNALVRAFRYRGHEVRSAASCEEARQIIDQQPPDLAVVDLMMPDGSGLDVLRHLKAISPAARVVVLSGYGSLATAVEAVQLGAANFLSKPAEPDEILAAFDAPSEPDAPHAFQPRSLARTEWEYIQRVLAACNGNVSEAARWLRIPRRSLQRKLRRHPPAD
jgi:two-component system response regulator RegA